MTLSPAPGPANGSAARRMARQATATAATLATAAAAALAVAPPAAADGYGAQTWTVTSDIGVKSRDAADQNAVTGYGPAAGETLTDLCQIRTGSQVGPYGNGLWHLTARADGTRTWVNDHWLSSPNTATEDTPGTPICASATGLDPGIAGQATTPDQPPAPASTYDRGGTTSWALAHARDRQRSGALCAWFVTQALQTGGLSAPGWAQGSDAARFVDPLMTLLQDDLGAQYQDITDRLATNAVPDAQVGDVIAYDWEGDGSFDHITVVTNIAAGHYPEVSGWGEFNMVLGWHHTVGYSSSYDKRGWTYSEMNRRWLQEDHPDMRVVLLALPG